MSLLKVYAPEFGYYFFFRYWKSLLYPFRLKLTSRIFSLQKQEPSMNKNPVCVYVLHSDKKKQKTQSLFDEFSYSFNT